MHHRLDYVAESRYFEPAAFVEFANKYASKFSVIGTGPDATVSTFFVDGLCKSYKDSGGRRLGLEEWKKIYGYE